MHTLLPLTESATNPGGARGGECKHITRFLRKVNTCATSTDCKVSPQDALASGNTESCYSITEDTSTKEFQTKINYKMSSVSMWKASYVSELKRYVKSSSSNGSRDVAVLQKDTSHPAAVSTKNVISHMVPNPH